METVSRFIGLDVHKKSITAAWVPGIPTGTRDVSAAVTMLAEDGKLLSYLSELGKPSELVVGYEAGPTGYGLCRRLRKLGYSCIVMAPTTITKASGDRIKTDKRDARRLAPVLRSGDFSAVQVPSETTEAMRDLERAREDVKNGERRARQELLGFLLRHGRTYSEGKHWTAKHVKWIESLEFDHTAQSIVRDTYLGEVRAATARLATVDHHLEQLAETWEKRGVVRALMAFRGIRLLTALTIVAELDDLGRFHSAPALMSYLGLVPSEHSSGDKRRQGRMTKAGNGHVRRVLVESAWAYRFKPRSGGAIGKRAAATSPEIQALAMKAQQRLHRRYLQLSAKSMPKPKVIACLARELAGFIWAVGQLPEAQAVTQPPSGRPTDRPADRPAELLKGEESTGRPADRPTRRPTRRPADRPTGRAA
jgi:transposase